MAENSTARLLDPAVLSRLMAQPLLTRFPMEGSISGHHKSPHRGSSVEFAEYRNYVPGDDIRRLDWRVFGRTDRFYLKEFEAETNLRCHLVLDLSGSMAFELKHGTKLDYARRMAATLAYLTVHEGDAAALLSLGKKQIEIPAKRTPAHLQLILDSLDAAEAGGETHLIQGLHDLAEKIRPRALVAIFSDLFCDVESLLGAFQHLRFRKHDVAVFHLLDRAETDFQFDRPVRFVDLESSRGIVTEPAMIRTQYLRALHAYMERMREGCHELKVDYRLASTDIPYEKILADFLISRAQASTAA